MYPPYIDERTQQRQKWQKFWPTSLVALIAVGQMLLTFAIVGSETWSMILNIKYSFLFIGYITAFFFTITWISTFTVVCCNRGSQGCATHALIENILSIIASSVLLYYNVRFLRHPWTCVWPGDICYNIYWNINWSDWWQEYNLDTEKLKLIAIKVQLSCAAAMLALSVIFMFIYIYTGVKAHGRSTTVNPQTTIELQPQQYPPPPPIPVWSTQQSAFPPLLNFKKTHVSASENQF